NPPGPERRFHRGVAREIRRRGCTLTDGPIPVAFRGNTSALPNLGAIPDRAEAVRTGEPGRQIQQGESAQYPRLGPVSTHVCVSIIPVIVAHAYKAVGGEAARDRVVLTKRRGEIPTEPVCSPPSPE